MGNFRNPNHKWVTQPEPPKIDPTTLPGSKKFDPDPSLDKSPLSMFLFNKCHSEGVLKATFINALNDFLV